MLVYPVLYILKSQAVELLPILYWDILSDLFTTQQSKRLYTLITAGGVLGTTLGSLFTGKVAHWIGADNVLLIFVTGMVLAAILNELTERVAGAPLEPRFLSLVAAPLTLIWIITSMKIKRNYSTLLMKTCMEDYSDWKHLEDLDFKLWLKDQQVVKRLRRGLEDSDPKTVLVSAEIIAKGAPAGWPKWIVGALAGKPAETQRALLDLLKTEDGKDAVEELLRIAPTAPPNTLAYLIKTLNRLDAGSNLAITERFLDHPDPRVRVEALAGLYVSHSSQAQTDFRQRIRDLLDTGEAEARFAIKVLGKARDPFFSEMLLESAKGDDPDLKAWALCGLAKMGHEEATEMALSAIEDLSVQVREAALQVLRAVKGKTPLAVWIQLLGNQDPRFRKEASMAIQERGEETVQDLLPVLASPSRVAKNEALSILTKLGPPRTDISHFIMKELEKPYRYAAYVRVLQKIETGKVFPLLLDHILERNNEDLEVVLRVLGVMEFGDKIEIILKALQSSNRRDKEHAIEALENSLHSKIRRVFIPLFEENPSEEQMTMVRKTLGIMTLPDSTEVILLQLLKDDDPIIQALTVYTLGEGVIEHPPINAIAEILDSETQIVREAAQYTLRVLEGRTPAEYGSQKDANLVEKAISFRKIPLFNDLRVQEIMAIAGKSFVREFSKGEVMIREGDPGDALYLIMEGEMAVIKDMGKEQELVLDRIGKDDFFGEMALLDGNPRSGSIRAESEALVLVLNGEDFVRIIEDYPSVPLKICGVLARRIRELYSWFRIPSIDKGNDL